MKTKKTTIWIDLDGTLITEEDFLRTYPFPYTDELLIWLREEYGAVRLVSFSSLNRVHEQNELHQLGFSSEDMFGCEAIFENTILKESPAVLIENTPPENPLCQAKMGALALKPENVVLINHRVDDIHSIKKMVQLNIDKF